VLTARVPDALDDEIATVLGTGSLGVEVAPSGPGMSELRVYLGEMDDAGSWRERAGRVLAAHGLEVAASQLAVEPVVDGRWVERWQASLAPIPLGDRFVVLPGAGASAHAGREPIRLVPGMAFGTGEHPTTRMCAAGLERLVAPGSTWLDLGTGTGLLAILASRCGAARVLAVDVDHEAVDVAREVIASNEATALVEVRAGSIEARSGETFDGVVANIQSSFFITHARALADALVEHGVLLASGFLREDVDEISSALAAAALAVEGISTDGPWVCLAARRLPA